MGEASTDTHYSEAIHQTLSAAISQSLKGGASCLMQRASSSLRTSGKAGKKASHQHHAPLLSSLTKEKYKVTSIRTDEEEPCLTFASCSFFPSSFARTTSIPRKQEKGRDKEGGEDELGLQGRRRVLAGGVKEAGEAKNTSLAAALPPPHVPMQPPAVCPSADCTSVSLLCVDAAV